MSIDTHPANDCLVVTYETLAVIKDEPAGRELGPRTKRDQFLINISAFDNVNEKTSPVNMRQLSEEILAKYPVLAEAHNRIETLEEIQLNLLYLFNRKQAQLSQPSRPLSSASMRLKSGVPSARSGRNSSANVRTKESAIQNSAKRVDSPMEVYQSYHERELGIARRQDFLDHERLDEFVAHLDEHLLVGEDQLALDSVARGQMETIETQLEDLYGEPAERRRSIAIIRQFVRDDAKLISVSSNRLLVCATLRILRDSGGDRDLPMSESILYCLIRFTAFEDVFNSMAFSEAANSADSNGGGETLDLVRVIVDLLDDQIRWLATNCEHQPKLLSSNAYYTNSLLVVLSNLLRLDHTDGRHRLKRKLLQLQNGPKLSQILTSSLSLLAKHLPRDIRTSNKLQERITVTLAEVLGICKQLSVFKQFLSLLRDAPTIQVLVDSLVTILNCLQLSRPGSGSSQLQQVLVNDRATLAKVYELELESMSLINNLIFDSKFRDRLARKSLTLKCVLRSLVVFLASSRKSNSLGPFSRSLVLLAPLKCLYELSCSEAIKRELFESRVIMRCLLEYLLISSLDLGSSTESWRQDLEKGRGLDDEEPARWWIWDGDLKLNDGDQIVLSAQDAGQFIVSLWCNLSVGHEAPIYKRTDDRDEEASRLLVDYIKSAVQNLDAFISLVLGRGRRQARQQRPLESLRDLHLMNYLHAKLIRNFSQFLDPANFRQSLDPLLTTVDTVLNSGPQVDTFVPLLVESLASVTNVIEASSSEYQGEMLPKVAPIVVKLFGDKRSLIDCSSQSGSEIENDDLLLVAINSLSTLARQHEICPHLKPIAGQLIGTINSILELRASDTQMLISVLFCFDQLMRHASFLEHFGALLDESSRDHGHGSSKRSPAHQLIEQLSTLVLHPDPFLVKLADQITNKLKQFEESRSLADSITSQKRFESYNSKWLHAIRTHREDPSDEDSPAVELNFNLGAHAEGIDQIGVVDNNVNEQQLEFDDYRQLRTINVDDLARTNSRLTSSSSMSQSSSRRLASSSICRPRHDEDEQVHSDDEDCEQAEEDEDDYDDDEDTFSEPDVNVIDSMSTIGHLKSRRELQR